MWLHAFNSFGCKKLIEFPLIATDVYNIGLPLLRPETFDVYVQLSPIEIKLLHLNSLYTSLLNDHDLASVSPLLRAKVIQTLFICSGCDFISFFAGIGKTSMMRIFYENAWLICGMDSLPETLAQTDIDNLKEGFLSFVRLVGLAFFKKHLSCFVHDTPRVLYIQLSS